GQGLRRAHAASVRRTGAMSARLLLATRNAGKLAELQRLLESAVPGVEVVGLRDVDEYPEAPETGATFAENALLKARGAVRCTGLPAAGHDARRPFLPA